MPCDSLEFMKNIFPLEAYGSIFKRIAQYEVPQTVKSRLDSIKNIAPNWLVDNFNIQHIDDEYGPVVNCDFFR